MSENNHSGETVLAFLVGGIVGAAVGLLLAPCSGEETRRRLGGWVDEKREKARDLVEKEKEALLAKKDQVTAAWEAGKKAYRESGGSAA
ncbi:MAG: YtxH domain-containing protein [Elusimicrobiota bacterium]|jgi:gas vesicle protein